MKTALRMQPLTKAVAAILFCAYSTIALAQSIPFPGPGSQSHSPVAIANTANNTDATANTTYTEAGVAIGTAAANRCVVVAFTNRANVTGRTISSVTIGGIAASNFATAKNDPGTSTDISAIYGAVVPTGTTATVVVTYNAGMLRLAYSVYAVTTSACSASTSNTNTAASGSSITNTLNVPASGGSISVVSYTNTASDTTSWTNTTKDYGVVVGGVAQVMSAAHETTTAAQTGLVITASFGGSRDLLALATASFAP